MKLVRNQMSLQRCVHYIISLTLPLCKRQNATGDYYYYYYYLFHIISLLQKVFQMTISTQIHLQIQSD